MILGRYRHPASACFDELNAAVSQLTDRKVCFNCHMFAPPADAIVYNLEDPRLTPNPRELWPGHEIWEHTKVNADRYGGIHVPVGYHPSMERFKRADEPDIDIVFVGLITERRHAILSQFEERGLSVAIATLPCYGQARDGLLARAKLVVDILSFDDGTFSSLRAAHLVANKVPLLIERSVEDWPFLSAAPYVELVDQACWLLHDTTPAYRASMAERAYEKFKAMPLVLPP